MSDDIAPPPEDMMEVLRSPSGHGWMIRFDGEIKACFSTAADMCSWIEAVLTPLDIEAGVIPRSAPIKAVADDDLPKILADAQSKIETKPARIWRVFAGGKS
jgi:hypothetical protein